MFGDLKAMGQIAHLIKDRKKLEQAGERIKKKLADTVVTGEAGGGAVRAQVTGRLEVHRIELQPSLIAGLKGDPQSREMAERLIREAVNDGLEKARNTAAELVETEADELGLGDLLGKMGLAEGGLAGILK